MCQVHTGAYVSLPTVCQADIVVRLGDLNCGIFLTFSVLFILFLLNALVRAGPTWCCACCGSLT